MDGDRERNNDELARTETAPESARTRAEAAPLGDTLGRYRLQREIGRGGMGVVHAAFDPDLERKVALKVLKGNQDDQARQRLLREARAMARVTHPNVVAVHEVGSETGRDFIAMELVDGVTLEDWLRETKRTDHEIIAAFVAAGRGLAAAHAAGLVHRDFKPRNVLRQKNGRVAVTDFGLVVGVGDPVASRANMAANTDDTPSTLSGLTATGAFLGTPAYMAPEQWLGKTIGPATDQFAFCVALWEALAGERPYRGSTLDALRDEVCHAKRGDDSKIPRRLRKILARGLEPDANKRYPSMEALLAAIARAERRPGIAVVLGGAAVASALVVILVLGRGSSAPSCAAPIVDPAAVWNAKDAAALRQQHGAGVADALDRDVRAWSQLRSGACKAPAATREPELACLDGVLVRLQAVKHAAFASKTPLTVDVGAVLLDPKICEKLPPPRLSTVASKSFEAVLERTLHHTRLSPLTEADTDAMVANAADDPCASALAHLNAAIVKIGATRVKELDDAESAAQRCGDDRIIADVAVSDAEIAVSIAAPDVKDKLERAEALVERVSQDDIEAELEIARGQSAVQVGKPDEAITRFEHAIALFERRGLQRSALMDRLALIRLHQLRARPEDLASLTASLDQLRQLAVEKVGEQDDIARAIDKLRAAWRWANGDIEAADRIQRGAVRPHTPEVPVEAHGRVVDETGAPVAGADVYVGPTIIGDSLHAARQDDELRSTKTGPDGRFTIKDAEANPVAIAQLGDQRSRAVTVGDRDIELVLQPTSKLSGTVALHGNPSTKVLVNVLDRDAPISQNVGLDAPVMPDGTFSISGVTRGRVRLQVVTQHLVAQRINSKDIIVDKPEVSGLQLEVMTGKRSLHALVRSRYGLALSNAQVFVIAGKRPASSSLKTMITDLDNATAKLAMPIQPNEANLAAVRDKAKPDDFYALITDAPDGEASACSFPMPRRLDDPDLTQALRKSELLDKIPVTCVPVAPNDEAVVISVQPWPRFD